MRDRIVLLFVVLEVALCLLPLRMSAVCAPSKVLVVGGGPLAVLTAKTLSSRGYETLLVTSEKGLSEELLSGPEESKVRLVDPALDEDVAVFEASVANCDALCVAYDSPRTLPAKLLDVVLPETSRVKRIALVSRHLNGEGQNPLVVASKAAANREVWALTNELKEAFSTFETLVRDKAEARGADIVTIRVGTLKGGGPGTSETQEEWKNAKIDAETLSRAYYAKCIVKDLVNWQLLFDCGTQGLRLTPGDSAPGPGWRAVFTSTSPEAEAGDSGRVATAQAIARALAHPNAGGKSFGINTELSRLPPSNSQWDTLLNTVLNDPKADESKKAD